MADAEKIKDTKPEEAKKDKPEEKVELVSDMTTIKYDCVFLRFCQSSSTLSYDIASNLICVKIFSILPV